MSTRRHQAGMDSSVICMVVVIACIAGICWFAGYLMMFSGFRSYDDEGYMLALLRESSLGGPLYSEIYSQYGPMFHWFWNGIFAVLGLSYTHDNGRILTLCCWILSSVIMGIGAWRQTRSRILGAGVQIVSFQVLKPLVNEPMHPLGLLAVLTSLFYLILTLEESSKIRSFLVGLLIVVMGAVKINFGVLSFIAISLFNLWGCTSLRKLKALTIPMLLLFLAPIWLVRSNPQLVILAGSSMISVWLAMAHPPIPRSKANSPVKPYLGGIAFGSGALLLIAISRGTSILTLLQGLVLRPLNQENVFSVPFSTAIPLILFSLGSLFVAVAFSFRGIESRLFPQVRLIFTGLAFGLTSSLGLIAVIPLTWIEGIESAEDKVGLERAPELPLLSILLFLTVFPVAGSQISLATLLFAPVIALLIGKNLNYLRCEVDRPELLNRTLGIGLALVCLIGVRQTYSWFRVEGYKFTNLTPLALPGARRIRLPKSEVIRIQKISKWITSNCDSFYALPGMNSFYILTNQSIPGRASGTSWWSLLNKNEERKVIASMGRRADNRQCVLRDDGLLRFWLQGKILPKEGLAKYLEEEFAPAAQVGTTQLLLKKDKQSHNQGLD